jgi:hypothetical protein
MKKIIFQINYDVIPEKRDGYLSSIKELKEHLTNNLNASYMVVEDKGKSNNFTEVYICNSEEEFENLEENTDDFTYELTNKLYSEFIVDKKARYTTLYEVE